MFGKVSNLFVLVRPEQTSVAFWLFPCAKLVQPETKNAFVRILFAKRQSNGYDANEENLLPFVVSVYARSKRGESGQQTGSGRWLNSDFPRVGRDILYSGK